MVDEIKARIGSGMRTEYINIEDDSGLHAGHRGNVTGGGHYRLHVVSSEFEGLNPLQRHRKINALLSDLMPHKIHALSLHLQTPAEWKNHS